MQRQLPRILIAAMLAFAPFALAHDDQLGPGTPDFTCQTPAEWAVHDYAGANGRTVAFISDNNLEECGTTYGLFIAGTPECRELEDRAGAGPGHPAWELLCNTDRPADYDGDLEFALGGALLAVDNGDGQTSGSLVCLGTVGHHTADISVQDEVFGSGVAFTVGADASLVPPPPGEPDCGDNVTRPCSPPNSGLGPEVDLVLTLLQTGNCNPNDHRVTCVGACTVPFDAGADGTYVVWVHPTANGGPGGTPTGASHGHIRNGGLPFCGPDFFVITAVDPMGGNNYHGQVTLHFLVGVGATLVSESVQWRNVAGNPAPNPNPVNENVHTGQGSLSYHQWTIGGSVDFLTREFEYKFETYCPVDGSTRTTSGTVFIYN